MSKYEELVARGMIAQTTNEAQVKELIDNGKAIFYVGFDPTADSLHVGHLLVMIAMKHLQEAGNKAIALIGGGTVMIGDPTGKTDMRRMMGRPEIEANCAVFRQQLSKFIDFSDDKAIMVDNGDWLLNLNYIEFLREVGVHFTVNRMLTFECYKSRLERGLSFIEFNYMLMQSYDFYKLYKNYGCNLQVGGDDQWANILGGTELVRRIDGDDVNGLTMKLLTTSEGKKMGKTEKVALWLDPEKCSPYEFYQYWRNVSDADVIRLMKIFTFLPLEEIAKYENLEGAQLNVAKEVLAYEITKLVHSEEDAKKAQDAARAMFGGGNAQEVPTLEVAKTDASAKSLLDILAENKLVPSKSEGRRLIQQKGIHFDDTPVEEIDFVMGDDCDGKVVRIGKKKRYRITLV